MVVEIVPEHGITPAQVEVASTLRLGREPDPGSGYVIPVKLDVWHHGRPREVVRWRIHQHWHMHLHGHFSGSDRKIIEHIAITQVPGTVPVAVHGHVHELVTDHPFAL